MSVLILPDGPLLLEHATELTASAIADDIVLMRGYRTVTRPSPADDSPRQELKRLGIPEWATKENRYFPGLLIPLYRPTGERISAVFKPRVLVPGRDGKAVRYAAAKGRPSVVDVHPVNRDRIADPTVPLWITEGVKKADALTSQGLCVAALSGVFNWRSNLGTLGDWEDIPLRGRQIVICFDADARTNPNVLRAMKRFGQWLRSKGVKSVHYLIVPGLVGDTSVKGADDFLAAGGTLDELRAAASAHEPRVENTDDTFTDARMAETVADEVLDGNYCWSAGKGWMRWTGTHWAECTDVTVGEAVRQYSLAQFAAAVVKGAQDGGNAAAIDGWRAMLSASRERAVVGLAKGIVERDGRDFDRHPDLLNTPTGVVDLETDDLLPHDPTLLMTKITGAPYRPGAEHSDWETALRAMPDDLRDYMQVRFGQAITGHMTPDDILCVLQGGGDNGKSTITDTMARAIGDYYLLVSERALLANPDAHPTELMDFQGKRLAVLEETPEARRLNTQRLKALVGTPRITARHVRKDSVTYDVGHSLFVNTNPMLIVEETDHGTWRRLMLIRFPFRFRKPHEAIEGPMDRRGDPTLRERCKVNPDVWVAALAWMVDGARKWYAAGRVMPQPPASVQRDTRAWRKESDLIMAYVDDQLVLDPGGHVMSTELLANFNDWLKSRGHPPWTDRTFGGRFGGHDEMAAHRVEKKRTRPADGLSRPVQFDDSGNWLMRPPVPPGGYQAWFGIRFAKDGDEKSDVIAENALTSENEDHVPAVPASPDYRAESSRKGLTEVAGTAGTRSWNASTVPDVPARDAVPLDTQVVSKVNDPRAVCAACGNPTNTYGHYRRCLRYPKDET